MKKINEQIVANALSKKYPSPRYAFLTQVRNKTGYSDSTGSIRTADALALGLWKSRGYFLQGFEIKVSRADWLGELRKPEKAESIQKRCDFWWLVISDPDIIKEGELPLNWGLKLLKGKSIVTIKEAVKNDSVEHMSREFLCGFLRKFTENIEYIYTPIIEVEKEVKRQVKNKIDYELSQVDEKVQKYDELVNRVKRFEELSGINMHQIIAGWGSDESIGDIGKAVAMVLNKKDVRVKDDLVYLLRSSERISTSIRQELKSLNIDD